MTLAIIRRWLSLCLIVLGTSFWFGLATVFAIDANNSTPVRLISLALACCVLALGALSLDNWKKAG